MLWYPKKEKWSVLQFYQQVYQIKLSVSWADNLLTYLIRIEALGIILSTRCLRYRFFHAFQIFAVVIYFQPLLQINIYILLNIDISAQLTHKLIEMPLKIWSYHVCVWHNYHNYQIPRLWAWQPIHLPIVLVFWAPQPVGDAQCLCPTVYKEEIHFLSPLFKKKKLRLKELSH